MTTEELKEAIVSAYLETGRDHSTAELAVRMGCSESTVRRALARCGGGAPDGVRAAHMTEEIRPRWYYGPTRAELRRRLPPSLLTEGVATERARAEKAEAEIQRLKETLRGAAGILRLEASLSTGRSKSALLGAAEELTRAAEERHE